MLTQSSKTRGSLSVLSPDLVHIAELTARMLTAGEADDWTTVSELETERYQLLSGLAPSCFEGTNYAAESVLRDALTSTRTLSDLAQRRRDNAQQALHTIRRGQQGAATYLEHAAR
jgi:Flagellar protein FliT